MRILDRRYACKNSRIDSKDCNVKNQIAFYFENEDEDEDEEKEEEAEEIEVVEEEES